MATTTPTSRIKTRSIAGHRLSLIAGERYVASRTIAHICRREYPVSIHHHDFPFGEPVVIIGGLNYDESNQLLNAFNNGYMSYDGRVW